MGILPNEKVEETQREFLQAIDRASDRLTRIVNDLVDMSQLEIGAMRLDRRRSTVSVIVKQLSDQLAAITGDHHLVVDVPPDLPPVYVDEVRLGQVIINLVSNAAAYSPEGTVIRLFAQHRDSEVWVSVSDQGIGIPPEHQTKVFDRFYRLESGVARRRGGTGLGLAICKGIVEAHGGLIWVESAPGKGSKFSFSLPAVEAPELRPGMVLHVEICDGEGGWPLPQGGNDEQGAAHPGSGR